MMANVSWHRTMPAINPTDLLDDSARKLVDRALSEAHRLGYSHIAPEHLLLALAATPDDEAPIARKALHRFKTTTDDLRPSIIRTLLES